MKEHRFCHYFEVPGQDAEAPEAQNDKAEVPNKTEFIVGERAQNFMDNNGISLTDGVLTFKKNPSIRMRFDNKTKKVTISANRGNLLISVEDVDGTAITYQTIDGSFIQAVNQKKVPPYVSEGMNKILTPNFDMYALNGDEQLQTALRDLQISFTGKGIEFGQEPERERINLTQPPPQHVEVRTDGKGNISFRIFYTPDQKKDGEKNLLFTLSKDGDIKQQKLTDPEVNPN